MFLRLVIYLAIISILISGGNIISMKSAKTAISDKELTTQTAQLDNALIRYYSTHGELPDNLSAEFMEFMGLYGISIDNFNYSAKERSFMLQTKYSTGQQLSPNSDVELPIISTEQESSN